VIEYKDFVIKYEFTSFYLLRSNSKAERINHMLDNHVYAIHYHVNILKLFWTETITTAVYLLNCLLSDSIDGIL